MKDVINDLLRVVNAENVWDCEPIFCFTSDMDWASDTVIEEMFHLIPLQELKLTTFVTHKSKIIDQQFLEGNISRGIHPNFLADSSHGNSFDEIIQTCLSFAPEAIGSRSHRVFDVTDVSHLLKNKYHFAYSSNIISTLGKQLRPILHESQLIQLPIFIEDGSFLYNNLGLSINPYLNYLDHPGIKIISFHPMNMVFNTPNIPWMRSIKDSMSRESFNNISRNYIQLHKNDKLGICNTMMEIINYVMKKNYRIMSMNELYLQLFK